jgi:hypothetical protein
MKKVPSEIEWDNYKNNPDSLYAYNVFSGKTNQEMQESFKINVLERVDELRWMPEKAFQYYMLGFRDYVMAGDFGFYDKADASCCFLELIIQQLEGQPNHIIPILPKLMEAVEYVGNNQSKYAADEEIYGSFKEKLLKIKETAKDHDL